MENDIKVFSNPEFGNIRTIKLNGNPFFVAKDVCEVLGILNHNETVARLDEDEKGVATIYPLQKTKKGGGKQKTLIISESGLYALVFQSRKAFAKAFRKWVTSEVLPTIRKTGAYKLAYPYEKRIHRIERLREIDHDRVEILQKWLLNIQSERDIYCEQVSGCTEIICTRDFSESENRIHLGKLLKSIRSESGISISSLSKLFGDNFPKSILVNMEQGKEDIPLSVLFKVIAALGYSVQFVKND